MSALNRLLGLACTLAVAGCGAFSFLDNPLRLDTSDGGAAEMGSCEKPADLRPTGPDCAAARGLTGDRLLCVDFAKVASLEDSQFSGWKFDRLSDSRWELRNGFLQIKDFPTFAKTCGLQLPELDLTTPSLAKYKYFTLSLIHRIDIASPNQTAYIYTDSSITGTRPLWQITDTPDIVRQQTVITIDKLDITSQLMTGFPFMLVLNSKAQVTRQGWQIESIAVIGSP